MAQINEQVAEAVAELRGAAKNAYEESKKAFARGEILTRKADGLERDETSPDKDLKAEVERALAEADAA